MCSHFNIEDGRKKRHSWHLLLYYFKKGKNTTDTHTHTQICAVYGAGAVTDGMCQKWFVKFHAGDFSLDDVPPSSRPIEVDNNQIKTLTENNQRYTTQESANTLKISQSTVIGENENVSLYFTEKFKQIFWPTE